MGILPPHQATASSTSAPAMLATAPLPFQWRRQQAPSTNTLSKQVYVYILSKCKSM